MLSLSTIGRESKPAQMSAAVCNRNGLSNEADAELLQLDSLPPRCLAYQLSDSRKLLFTSAGKASFRKWFAVTSSSATDVASLKWDADSEAYWYQSPAPKNAMHHVGGSLYTVAMHVRRPARLSDWIPAIAVVGRQI